MKRKAETHNLFLSFGFGGTHDIPTPPKENKNKFHAKHLVQNSRFHFHVIQEVSFI